MNPALWAEEDGFLDDPETREAALREALIWAGSKLPDTTHAPEPEPEAEPGAVEANAAAAAADIAARLAAMEVVRRSVGIAPDSRSSGRCMPAQASVT